MTDYNVFNGNRDVFIRRTSKDWCVERPSGWPITRHATEQEAIAFATAHGFENFGGADHYRRPNPTQE